MFSALKEDPAMKEVKSSLQDLMYTYSEDDEAVSTGIMWALIGDPKTHKSITAGLACYLNLEFKDTVLEPYPGVIKALKNGAFPEVEHTYILDTEFVWRKRMLNPLKPKLYDLFKPLWEAKRFHVIPIFGEGKRKRLNAEATRKIFEDVIEGLRDFGEGIAVVSDSFTDYYRHLNAELKRLHGKDVITTMKPGTGENDAIMRPFWEWRNDEWEATMKAQRRLDCHFFDTFKCGRRWHTDKTGKNPQPSADPRDSYAKWCSDSEYWFEETVWFYNIYNIPLEKVETIAEFSVATDEKKCGCAFLPKENNVPIPEGKGACAHLYELIAEEI